MKSETTNEKKSTEFISFPIKPEARDIFIYKMYHAFFANGYGITRLIISAVFLFFGFYGIGRYEWYLVLALFVIGILNPIVTPVMYYSQSSKAAKARIPIQFTFLESKVIADDRKTRVELKWEEIFYIVWLKKEMLLYTNQDQALVLPRAQMKGQDDEVLEMIKAHARPTRWRIRKHL